MIDEEKIDELIYEILEIKDENERINQLIDLLKETKNYFPFDSSSRSIAMHFPKENHESLGLPGVFVKRLDTQVVTFYNRSLRLDQATLVMPDDIIKAICILNTEYQSEPPDLFKKIDIFDYKHGIINEYGLYCVSVVVGNFGLSYDSEKIYEANEHKYNVFIRNINDNEVQKRLNTTTDIIDNNKDLSCQQALNIAYVCIYASTDIAKDIIEKAVILFTKAKITNIKLKLTIFNVLKNMINHRFRDDEENQRRLLKMTINALNQREMYELPWSTVMDREFRKYEQYIHLLKKDKLKDTQTINDMLEAKKRDDSTIASMVEAKKRDDKEKADMRKRIKELEEELRKKDNDESD